MNGYRTSACRASGPRGPDGGPGARWVCLFAKSSRRAVEIEELRARIDSLEPVEANFDSYSTPEELVYGNLQGGGFFLKHIKCAFNRDPIFLKYLDDRR